MSVNKKSAPLPLNYPNNNDDLIWGHTREQFDNLFYRNQCKNILESYIIQFEVYINSGYNIKDIISINELVNLLQNNNLDIPILGLDQGNLEKSNKSIISFLK